MKNLLELVGERKLVGANEQWMEVKICQEIFLAKAIDVGVDTNFTVKGGVALYELTHGDRGFTKDIDLDLISYSIDNDHIFDFFKNINSASVYENISLEIIGQPIELHHANYKGKSVQVLFKDTEGNHFSVSFDFGVHASSLSTPTRHAFLTHLEGTERKLMILIDPSEQMIVEKLSGFIKFGARSTRTKDIFDVYWLLKNTQINQSIFYALFENIAVVRNKLGNVGEAVKKLTKLFELPSFQTKAVSLNNWLDVDAKTAILFVVTFINHIGQGN